MTPTNILSDFQGYAESLVQAHKVPAVSLAVWHNHQLHQAAAGILNIDTGVTATTDSIFQIGSITKVMTASLIMQLVDEGRIALDTPVKHYLRDFTIIDRQASNSITPRQLLSHTSGIAGDFCPDDTRESGNHIARFLDRCYQLPLIHPVGEYYSYSNTAYAIAGRLIEVVTGHSWFDAMEERLFKPLKMNHAICRPMDVLRYRAAIGHFPSADDPSGWRITDNSYPTLGQAPAGTTATMTAADLIVFARAHLNKGLGSGGQRWLSENAVAQMQQGQVMLPRMSTTTTSYAGLGWGLRKINHNGRVLYSHLGATFGQRSLLRVVPDQNTCIAVLVNSDKEGVVDSVAVTLLKALADIDLTEPESTLVTLTREQLVAMTGVYASIGDSYTLTLDANQLVATHENKLHNRQQRLQLTPLDNSTLVAHNEQGEACYKFRFLSPDTQGRYGYLYGGARLHQRI